MRRDGVDRKYHTANLYAGDDVVDSMGVIRICSVLNIGLTCP